MNARPIPPRERILREIYRDPEFRKHSEGLVDEILQAFERERRPRPPAPLWLPAGVEWVERAIPYRISSLPGAEALFRLVKPEPEPVNRDAADQKGARSRLLSCLRARESDLAGQPAGDAAPKNPPKAKGKARPTRSDRLAEKCRANLPTPKRKRRPKP